MNLQQVSTDSTPTTNTDTQAGTITPASDLSKTTAPSDSQEKNNTACYFITAVIILALVFGLVFYLKKRAEKQGEY